MNTIATAEIKDKKLNIMVYGLDRAGFTLPINDLSIGNVTLTFEAFDTDCKFQEFDGVILFQGIWAHWKEREYLYVGHDDYLVDVQNDMLRVRVKQLQSLLEKQGFICFLMKRMSHNDFDLAKDVLSWFSSTYYDAINDCEFFHKIYFNELASYLNSDFGVSKTKYKHYGESNYRVLANISGYDGDTAVCFNNKIFYIPCHIINKDASHTHELFKTLIPGLISTYKKLNQELPEWVQKFTFVTEDALVAQKEKFEGQLSVVEQDLLTISEYKKPLVLTSNLLTESIKDLLVNGFNYVVTNNDVGFEDIQIWDKPESEKGKTIAIIEVKGVNGNVNREAINQVDDHRERNGLKDDFPGILIANTFIKQANTLKEKDKPIEEEQVKHAVKMNVLILRTIDLIRALDLVLANKLTSESFMNMLLKERGWLEVSNGKIVLHSASVKSS